MGPKIFSKKGKKKWATEEEIAALPEPVDAEDAQTLTQVKGDVRLEGVDFSYIPGTPIIKDLHFIPRVVYGRLCSEI